MITSLKPNEYIVVGTNLNGHHYGGGAAQAFSNFGALWGEPIGCIGGQSYGIATLNQDMDKMPIDVIEAQVLNFKYTAESNSNKTFYLTPIGCGIAGFKRSEIKPLFKNMPPNVIFTEEWEESER